MCGFCNVWLCVGVDFVMYVRVCSAGFVMCEFVVCVFCNVSLCVCLDFVMCGCAYVWIL